MQKPRERCQEPVSRCKSLSCPNDANFQLYKLFFDSGPMGLCSFGSERYYLKPLETDCATKSLSGRSVMSVSGRKGIYGARKSQQSQSARAGGRVLKNLSRVKWKPVARERPRSRSRENRRLPISESDWRRQNVQSRCGQCVGTQNALHFLITQAWHD